MLEPKQLVIDGMDFQFTPMPALKAARLDRKVLAMIAPIFGGLEELSLTAGISVDGLMSGIRQALSSLTDDEFEGLLVSLLGHVKCQIPGKPPIELGDASAINEAFAGRDLLTMYRVAIEVMRYNKFTPFALASTGDWITRIAGSAVGAGLKNASGKGLAS